MEAKRLQTARFLGRQEARERLWILALERSALLQEYPELRERDRARQVSIQRPVKTSYRRLQRSS